MGQRSIGRSWLLLLLLLALIASAGDASEAIDQALGAPGLRGSRLSVLVVDRESGDLLYARHPDRPLVPASNQKLLTAVAALATWGPSHRFETEVLAPGPVKAHGELAGLYVRGAGDPSMTSEQWWRLAADLRALGVVRIRGPLVLDDRAFDDERWHSSWQPISARAYHAPVGALSANYGAFRVRVAPGAKVGGPARVTLDPPVPYLKLQSQAQTGPPGSQAALTVDRVALGTAEQVRVSGSLPYAGEAKDVYRSVAHPTRYAAAVLRQQLAANGIVLEGPTRRAPVPRGAEPLLAFEGFALGRIVTLFVKNSNNMIAEALVKLLGRGPAGEPGTWPRGLAAMRSTLASLGIDLDGVRLADGSGLSRDNRVSARVLVDVLRAADRRFEMAPELLAALPIAGRDGTLKKRASTTRDRLRAKTGLLTGVTALTGIAQTTGGREVVFSILANGYTRGDRAAMNAVDAFAEAVVGEGW
ncbi:MAG: D-alanyl-D-alanine carboxypeptidase/D-alanyl-D-alanine-endopeptidase [Deltaproteobacteria bacterium]|nr:D-alanyl-D-alanine carboxypeptidase/D-alanyl-D-alanine-endopeptidase [Deltaproteobacteria bacterium]MBW2395049.1 D-alanyl-D-alanine carboxypeptidase/D-alanyl-D-alanine-endopeptidase [Deltaproteobacteria bacterium]